MRKRYRLFRRGNVFWCQGNETGKQESLRTKDPGEAERLLHARNEAHRQPVINLQIARAYLPERRAFYELAWHLGASQSDLAFLEAENIDWQDKVISFARKKTGQQSFIRFGEEVEAILRELPNSGPLFPYLRGVRHGDRATEFHQRCEGLGIKGVSLHSYRYAWAERARRCGYPERFAQEALGHNSIAVHRAYASKAKVVIPPLEPYEKQAATPSLIPMPKAASPPIPAVPKAAKVIKLALEA